MRCLPRRLPLALKCGRMPAPRMSDIGSSARCAKVCFSNARQSPERVGRSPWPTYVSARPRGAQSSRGAVQLGSVIAAEAAIPQALGVSRRIVCRRRRPDRVALGADYDHGAHPLIANSRHGGFAVGAERARAEGLGVHAGSVVPSGRRCIRVGGLPQSTT
jgi:hypothetical protein